MSKGSSRATMAQWVEDYLDVGIQSRSHHTRKLPRPVLIPFAEWYDGQQRAPRNVSADDLVRFMLRDAPWHARAAKAGRKIAPQTHNTYWRLLREFIKWALKTRRFTHDNPVELLEAVDTQSVPERNFTRATGVEMAQLVADCPVLRDKALLAAAFNHGPRSSEIQVLRLGDIDLGRGVIAWRIMKGGAGEVSRILEKRIPPMLDRILREWITAYTTGAVPLVSPGKLPQAEWYAFPARQAGRGKAPPIYNPAAQMSQPSKVVQRYTVPVFGKKRGDLGMHFGRRSLATALEEALAVDQGMDAGTAEVAVQGALGHKSVNTTRLYTGNPLPQRLANQALARDYLPDVTNVTQLRKASDG